MLHLVAILSLVAISQSRIWLPTTEDGVLLGTGADFSDCQSEDVYGTPDALVALKTEDEFICAFVAFQHNKEPLDIQYVSQSDANMRYELFKTCVAEAIGYNEEADGWVAGVTLFCDMTPEEEKMMMGLNPVDWEERDEKKPPMLGGMGGPPGSAPKDGENDTGNDMPPIPTGPRKIWVPTTEEDGDSALQASDYSGCDDKVIYDSADAVSDIQTEDQYICAFVAFQHNKDKKDRPYLGQEDANMRYQLFKDCVDSVKKINEEEDSWEAGINFFCDMTEEEKSMRMGLVIPEGYGARSREGKPMMVG